ncbi:uncharacterized protein LOC144664790 [Oculina patagonica]
MYTNFFAFGTLLALIVCLTDVSCQPAESCSGSPRDYCLGESSDMKAVCRNGYCYCTGQDYDYYTCLPDAYGCKIVENAATALGKPRRSKDEMPQDIYSCTPASSSEKYEVHVLSVSDITNTKTIPPTTSNATVTVISRGESDRPIILVLATIFEPVNWIFNLPANITISEVILVGGFLKESFVSGLGDQEVERKNYTWGMGWDSVVGDTVALLRQLYNRFGVVTSFTGIQQADTWTLEVSVSRQEPSTSQHHTSGSSSLFKYKTAEMLNGFLVIAVMILNKQYLL